MNRDDNRPRTLAEADAARRMEIAQDLATNPDRAPQPWNESRADGWPVADAIFAFAHESVRRQVSFHLAFRAEGINDPTSTSTLTSSGWDWLRHRLSQGELTATGFAHGEPEVRQMHPSLFDQAEYDSASRNVTAAALSYSGVRVFSTPVSVAPVNSGSADDHPGEKPKLTYSPEALCAWFIFRVVSWPADAATPAERDCQIAAAAIFHTLPSRGEFRKIRAANTPSEWRKQGPRATR